MFDSEIIYFARLVSTSIDFNGLKFLFYGLVIVTYSVQIQFPHPVTLTKNNIVLLYGASYVIVRIKTITTNWGRNGEF